MIFSMMNKEVTRTRKIHSRDTINVCGINEGMVNKAIKHDFLSLQLEAAVVGHT